MVFRHGCYLLLLLLAHFTALGLSAVKEPARRFPSRVKRNIFQFGRMIKCETGRSAWAYIGYGCYCGLGGKGTPVDGVDNGLVTFKNPANFPRQWLMTELLGSPIVGNCYDRIKDSGTCFFNFYVYTNIYSRVGCSGCAPRPENNRCELAICVCDKAAARCFANNKFNRWYEDHPNYLC
ncbi:acidic phospholipase A2 2-like [Stylophora pistillata]|uniref:acidic phospholipase A2 2-like n=1 Tax=Stylophora pistillata TaxID=50429 RepID=UPI000C03AF00|nr:acidic phospholipase A2 2-like [Stylophora pistillata]